MFSNFNSEQNDHSVVPEAYSEQILQQIIEYFTKHLSHEDIRT